MVAFGPCLTKYFGKPGKPACARSYQRVLYTGQVLFQGRPFTNTTLDHIALIWTASSLFFSRIWVESGESLGREEVGTRRDWDETG